MVRSKLISTTTQTLLAMSRASKPWRAATSAGEALSAIDSRAPSPLGSWRGRSIFDCSVHTASALSQSSPPTRARKSDDTNATRVPAHPSVNLNSANLEKLGGLMAAETTKIMSLTVTEIGIFWLGQSAHQAITVKRQIISIVSRIVATHWPWQDASDEIHRQ